jgi:putative ABC transport system substrate-binding protein
VRRRQFMGALGGAAAWPLAAHAQQIDQMRKIGLLLSWGESEPEARVWIGAFVQRLSELGWTDGRNIRMDYRWGAGDANRIRTFAAELVALKPDLILGNTTTVLATLKEATSTIPIVFLQVSDPVAGGFVASLARPGGNITGFTTFEYPIAGKWLEMLKEFAPATARALVIGNSKSPSWSGYMSTTGSVAQSLGIQMIPAGVSDSAEIECAIDSFAQESKGALVVIPDNLTLFNRDRLVAMAALHRLPATYPYRNFVTGGGLISYGPESVDLYKRAAAYVDRILKGKKASDLPIQAPVKFEMVINLKTAKALGLTVPETLLVTADVIE